MRKFPIAATALLLAGCSLAPPHVRPDLPTAPVYPPTYSGDTLAGQRAADIRWDMFLVDPRLDLLVGQALQRNRDLLVAVGRIEEARGLYRIQNADRLPTVDSTGSAIRQRVQGPDGPETSSNFAVGVGVTSFELDFWGRVRNLSEAARREYFATIQAQRAFRLTLIRDTASTYFASLEAAERVALAESTVATRQEALRIAQRRLDAGVTSELDYRQAETLLTDAQRDLASLKLTKAQNDNFLNVLVGGPLTVALPPPLPLARQTASPALSAGLPSELLTNRPDILADEDRLRAARANIGAARAAFFPSISLTGNAGFASSQLGSLFGGDGLTWSFGPSIRLPIFDGGRNRANLTVAQARENIAVATYEKTVQQAFREVADALAGRTYYAEQIAAQERGLIANQRIARLATLRYREGVASYLEVLDAERNLFLAQQALVQTRRLQASNSVALYVALGGGSQP
jgi:multidrug efflux system outer membrane protein